MSCEGSLCKHVYKTRLCRPKQVGLAGARRCATLARRLRDAFGSRALIGPSGQKSQCATLFWGVRESNCTRFGYIFCQNAARDGARRLRDACATLVCCSSKITILIGFGRVSELSATL